MSGLRIADGLCLPLDTTTSTLIVYGGKGMGKTNFGSVLVEELSRASQRFSVLDPVGVWYGLRHAADGASPGVEALILGGVHGDLEIAPSAGAAVAEFMADEDVDIIVDISRHRSGSMWSVGEKIRFTADYCGRLYERQGERLRPMQQVIDEAGRFVPQAIPSGAVDIARCVGAIEQLVELGRNVGVGVTLITQRSARMNKSVSELADAMVAFRTVGPRSIDAIMDWLGEHVERSRVKGLVEQIRALPIGTALVVSPGWLQFEGLVAMRARRTFDSSATPNVHGVVRRATGPAAMPDLERYRARFAAPPSTAEAACPACGSAERARESNGPALRSELAERDARIDGLLAREHDLLMERDVLRREVADLREAIAGLQPEVLEADLTKADAEMRAARYALKYTWDLTKDLSAALQGHAITVEMMMSAAGYALERTHDPAPPLTDEPSHSPFDGSAETETRNGSGRPPAPIPAGVEVSQAGASDSPALAPAAPISRPSRPRSAPVKRAAQPPAPRTTTALSAVDRTVLGAVASLTAIGVEQPSRAAVAGFAGYKQPGRFRQSVGSLVRAGLLSIPAPDALALTDAGRGLMPVEQSPTLGGYHDAWRAGLRDVVQRRMFDVLLSLGRGASITRADLASELGYKQAGRFRQALSYLATIEAVTYLGDDRLAPADLLFPPGLTR